MVIVTLNHNNIILVVIYKYSSSQTIYIVYLQLQICLKTNIRAALVYEESNKNKMEEDAEITQQPTQLYIKTNDVACATRNNLRLESLSMPTVKKTSNFLFSYSSPLLLVSLLPFISFKRWLLYILSNILAAFYLMWQSLTNEKGQELTFIGVPSN